VKREDLHEGQEVIISVSLGSGQRPTIPGKIASIRRTLLTVEYPWAKHAKTETFVIETQRRHYPKNAYLVGTMGSDRFWTLSQWAEAERERTILERFKEAGLALRHHDPFHVPRLTLEQMDAAASALDPHRIPLAITLEEARELLTSLDTLQHLGLLPSAGATLMTQLVRGTQAVQDHEQREAEERA
jgi:hypothetical protein